MQYGAAVKSRQMVTEMRTNLAVLLNEMIERGGELQIKRKRGKFGLGSKWELILWTPPASKGRNRRPDLWPQVMIRLQATSSLELVNGLERKLETILNPEPVPEPASAPLRVGEQLALV